MTHVGYIGLGKTLYGILGLRSMPKRKDKLGMGFLPKARDHTLGEGVAEPY